MRHSQTNILDYVGARHSDIRVIGKRKVPSPRRETGVGSAESIVRSTPANCGEIYDSQYDQERSQRNNLLGPFLPTQQSSNLECTVMVVASSSEEFVIRAIVFGIRFCRRGNRECSLACTAGLLQTDLYTPISTLGDQQATSLPCSKQS